MWQKSEREIQHRGKQDCNVVCGGGLTMSISFEYDDHVNTIESLRAKMNDMLTRIASLEDKVRELYYLVDCIRNGNLTGE